MTRSSTKRVSSPMARSVIVGAMIVLLSVGAGALWAVLSPKPEFIVRGELMGQTADSMREMYGGIGIFALISAGLGLLIALLVWMQLPRQRGLIGVGYTLLAAIGAAALAMASGHAIADAMTPEVNPHVSGTYHLVIDLNLPDAMLGSTPVPWILLIVAPGFAALTCFFLALASNHADLGAGDLPATSPVALDPAVTSAGAA